MTLIGRFWLFLALWVGLASGTTPLIERPVNDRVGVLSEGTVATLESKLRVHRDAHGVQMAVLVVRSTGAEPIEDFAIRVASDWGGGSKERDDGVLFVLAVDDRRMRLELGYGMEAWIPDATAKAILAEAIPYLQRQHYGAATEAVVDGVIERTSGAPPPEVLHPTRARTPVRMIVYFVVFLVCAFVGRVLRSRRDAEVEEDPSPFATPRLGMALAWMLLLVATLGTVPALLGFGWGHYFAAAIGCVAGWKFLFREPGGTLTYVILAGLGCGIALVAGTGLFGDSRYIPAAIAITAHIFFTWLFDPSGSLLSHSFGGGGSWSGGSGGSFSSGGGSFGGGSFGGGGGGWSGGGGSFGGGGASSSW